MRELFQKFLFLASLISFSAVDNFVYITTKTKRIVTYIFSSAADILINKQVRYCKSWEDQEKKMQ